MTCPACDGRGVVGMLLCTYCGGCNGNGAVPAQPHRFSSGDATGPHAPNVPQSQPQAPQANPVGTFRLPDGRTFTTGEQSQ